VTIPLLADSTNHQPMICATFISNAGKTADMVLDVTGYFTD
jgi:hypothetical protein